MTTLKALLMTSAAAISLAAAPALAQQAETPEPQTPEAMAEAPPAARSYEEVYGEPYADWGDRSVEELIGTTVVNDAGETIGDVDNFGLAQDQIVAIVGIGGFLGLGEHQVAIPLEQLAFDGEQLLLAGVTREQLEALPEYDEGEAQTFAADQTLRTGYETVPMPGTAAEPEAEIVEVEPSEQPAADQPMADEDVADAAEADATVTVEQQTAAGQPAEGAVEGAGQEMAEAAEETGEAVEGAGQEAAQEVAEAGEQVTAEGEEMADAAGAEVTEEAGEIAAETEMAEAEDAQPVTEEAEAPETAQVTEGAAPAEAEPVETETAGGWTEEMDTIFADIADQQIAELIGMEVASAEGEVVGEVDNFALQGEDVVAIVGVGGFLGMGEHEVALPLGEMTFDGERLVLSSITEDQLREMPEYDEAEANYLPEEGTLRQSYAP